MKTQAFLMASASILTTAAFLLATNPGRARAGGGAVGGGAGSGGAAGSGSANPGQPGQQGQTPDTVPPGVVGGVGGVPVQTNGLVTNVPGLNGISNGMFNPANNRMLSNGLNGQSNIFMPSSNGFYRFGTNEGFLRGTNGFYRRTRNGLSNEFYPDRGDLDQRGADGMFRPFGTNDTRGIYRNGVLYNDTNSAVNSLPNGGMITNQAP